MGVAFIIGLALLAFALVVVVIWGASAAIVRVSRFLKRLLVQTQPGPVHPVHHGRTKIIL